MSNKSDTILEPVVIGDIPNGSVFISKSGAWVLHSDFKAISFYNNLTNEVFQLDDLKLEPGRDRIESIDFVDNNKKIFLSGFRNGKRTCFLYSLRKQKGDIQFPRMLSFSPSSTSFHCNVLSAFTPSPSTFCIISKEGVTLHNLDFEVKYSLVMPIQYCCNNENYILIGHDNVQLIFRVDGSTVIQIAKMSNSDFGQIMQLIPLSHSLILVCKDGNKNMILLKLPISNPSDVHTISLPINATYDTLTISPFDNALLVTNIATGRTLFIDVFNSEVILSNGFTFVPGIKGIYCNNYCLDSSKRYEIRTLYDALTRNTKQLIASLLRRSNGIFTAIKMLNQRLQNSPQVNKVQHLVEVIAPSATSPIAQIRVARALQYGGLRDPHMILLALLKFAIILGDSMTDDSRVALIEAVSHPACRNTLNSLLVCWKVKLNKSALRIIAQKCDEHFSIDPVLVEDILDFAEVSIDFGKQLIAKQLLMRATLDGTYPADRLSNLKDKYKEHFGSSV